jgi:hypothetical protein
METAGRFAVEDVLPYVVDNPKEAKEKGISLQRLYDGHPVSMSSLRYQTFKHRGLECCWCGIKGEYFLLERYPHSGGGKRRDRAPRPDPFHFNLYAEHDGEPVLMTKDHVVPVALDGRDRLENMRTMCFVCNGLKSAHLEDASPEAMALLDKEWPPDRQFGYRTLREVIRAAKDDGILYAGIASLVHGKHVGLAGAIDVKQWIFDNLPAHLQERKEKADKAVSEGKITPLKGWYEHFEGGLYVVTCEARHTRSEEHTSELQSLS